MVTRAVLFERFLGRTLELEHLCELRDRSARELTQRAASIAGEAGVGKSRLLTELERAVHGTRSAFVRARCDELSFAYGPIVDVLERLHRKRELAQNVPLSDALRALTSAGDATTEDDDRKRAINGTVTKALGVAARRLGQLTLAIDDLHWSDLATLDMLGTAARMIRDAPLLLIVAYRPEDVAGDHTSALAIGNLERHGFDRINLAPLAFGDVATLVREALPHTSEAASQRIYAMSEGKPYVAEELARSFAESGTLDAGVVLSLRAAVLARVERLAADEREIIERAAVLGRNFEPERLRALGASDELLLRALRAALRLQLLEEREVSGAPWFRFRHALTREILYQNLTSNERRSLHKRIAEHLVKSGSPAALLAYHVSAAGDAEAAVDANERAGDDARALAAYADATVSYLRALDFTDEPAIVARIGLKLAKAFRNVGHGVDETFAAIERIAGRLADGGRPDDALAMLVAEDAVRLATNRFGEVFGRIERGKRLLHAATPKQLRFDFELMYAHCLMVSGRYQEALAAAQRAEDIGLPTAHAHNAVQLSRALTNVYRHDIERSQAAIASLRPEDGAKSHINEGLALSHLADVYAPLGRLREAFDLTLRAASVSERAGSEWGRWRQRFHAAFYAAELGDFGYVEELAVAAEREGLERGDALEGALVRVVRAKGGDGAALIALFENALENRSMFLLHALVCDLPFIVDDRDVARSIVRRGIERLPAGIADGGVVEAAIVFGSDDDVAVAVRRFNAECRNETLVQRLEHHLVDARLAARSHRSLEAMQHARAAIPLATQTGQWLNLATAHELAGDRATADTVLSRVGAVAERGRLARHRGLAQVAINETVTLTSRELQVARSFAAGLSSREVSARLAIGARTVETHLGNVYRKLGIGSRAELTTWLESDRQNTS